MNIYGYICKSENPDFEFFVKMATDETGKPIVSVTKLENGLVVIPVSIWQEPTASAPLHVRHEEAAKAHGIAGDYAGMNFPVGTPDSMISSFKELAAQHANYAIELSKSLGMLKFESEMHDGYDHFGLRRRHMTITQALKN